MYIILTDCRVGGLSIITIWRIVLLWQIVVLRIVGRPI